MNKIYDLHIVGHLFSDCIIQNNKKLITPGGTFNVIKVLDPELKVCYSQGYAEATINLDNNIKTQYRLEHFKINKYKAKWTHIAYIDHLIECGNDIIDLRENSDIISVDIAQLNIDLLDLSKVLNVVDYIFISHTHINELNNINFKPKIGMFVHWPNKCKYIDNQKRSTIINNDYYDPDLKFSIGAGDIFASYVIQSIIKKENIIDSIKNANKNVIFELKKEVINNQQKLIKTMPNINRTKVGKFRIIGRSYRTNAGKAWRYVSLCDCGGIVNLEYSNIKRNSRGCGACYHGSTESDFKGYKEIHWCLFNSIKKKSSGRGLEFNVTIEYLWDLFIKQERKCALTKIDICFSRVLSRNRDCTASLDRIDSSKGYIEGNVQWVHKDINYMKQDYDQNYYIEMCKKVAEYNK